jgi:hypothetical protein
MDRNFDVTEVDAGPARSIERCGPWDVVSPSAYVSEDGCVGHVEWINLPFRVSRPV